MSILSDKSIKRNVVEDNRISINPYSESHVQPASYDVSLGEKIYDFECDRFIESDEHTIEPFTRYLGHTNECVDLPNNIAGQLAGRSSVGRRGIIVHKTAGFIDPSFTGDITLEIMNFADDAVTLKKGERIAQVVFFELDRQSSGYDGKYQNQSGPTKSKQDK